MSSGQAEALFDRLRVDESVLGVFLSGSRGKGFHTDTSDYDVYIVVADEGLEPARRRYPFRYSPIIDCIVTSLSAFRAYAEPGAPGAWDRYSFAHVEVLFGNAEAEIQRLVDRKGRLPPELRNQTLRDALDAYLNAVYRAFKRLKQGDGLGAKLEAARSIPPLLSFLFGLYGRHAPFAGYLERELDAYPLGALPVSAAELLAGLEGTLQADAGAMQTLLRHVDALGRDEGLADVTEGWDEAYPWMLRFSAEASAATPEGWPPHLRLVARPSHFCVYSPLARCSPTGFEGGDFFV